MIAFYGDKLSCLFQRLAGSILQALFEMQKRLAAWRMSQQIDAGSMNPFCVSS